MWRVALVAMAALGLLAGSTPARAEGAETLIVGTTRLLTIRNGDTLNGREWTIHDRIAHVHDVMPKYLGGEYGKFTTKKWGDRVHIYLNGDFILAVTPTDAKATGYKSTDKLAPVWVAALKKGFEEGHSNTTRGGGPPASQ